MCKCTYLSGENGIILDIIEVKDPGVPLTQDTRVLEGVEEVAYPIIAPAFIDIQIYGAHGKLFSQYPNVDSLHKLYKYCSCGGASHFQVTVATNTYEVFRKSIDAVRDYWREGGKGCIGLHIEGPWINPIKRGAHIESCVKCNPSAEDVRALLNYGKDVITMITLAPEVCSREILELVTSYGIVISAGHSNATYDEAMAAFDFGIGTATHLFNAMSPLQHRAPGLVGAVLNHTSIMSSVIPDGHHVDYAAIRIAKSLLKDRLFIITDAVTVTTEGPYQHILVGDKYEADGILSGSALNMIKSVENLMQHVGVDVDDALRMASLYPAKAIRKSDVFGTIGIGKHANFVLLDDSLQVLGIVSSS